MIYVYIIWIELKRNDDMEPIDLINEKKINK